MQKVKIESVMWGAGTALGELPPYFMARASRLSGYDPDDEDDLKEFEELQKKSVQNPDSMVGSIDANFLFIIENKKDHVGLFLIFFFFFL